MLIIYLIETCTVQAVTNNYYYNKINFVLQFDITDLFNHTGERN